MNPKLIVSLAAVAAATTLLSGSSQAASPADVGPAPDQSVMGAPIEAVDFTKYSGKDRAVDAPVELPAAEPSHIRYVRNLASGRLPEPGAWALMLIGFGGAGALLRHSRRQARAASI
ncbi:MAG: PEP-CTERM sorting domain-containing protein [Phenylobacterium sp.]